MDAPGPPLALPSPTGGWHGSACPIVGATSGNASVGSRGGMLRRGVSGVLVRDPVAVGFGFGLRDRWVEGLRVSFRRGSCGAVRVRAGWTGARRRCADSACGELS